MNADGIESLKCSVWFWKIPMHIFNSKMLSATQERLRIVVSPYRFLTGLILIVVFALTSNPSWARVDVVPKRLIFEPGQRAAMVTLINRSNESYTYRMGWEDLVYSAQGAKRVDDGAERVTPKASDFIRFAPRQVVLRPGESQSIRVLLRRPADLAAGEYRSHFRFQRQGQIITQKASGPDGVAINIRVAMGISIPIIVRQGGGEPDVAIVEALIQEKDSFHPPRLQLTLKRNGDYSSYANIELWEDSSGEPRLLAQGYERPLLTDMKEYAFTLPLSEAPKGKDLRLKVSYTLRNGGPRSLEEIIHP